VDRVLPLGKLEGAVSHDVKILIALPDGEGGGAWEEFVAEDFSAKDVLGHVFGFEAVAGR
jgi:hypothetical protein